MSDYKSYANATGMGGAGYVQGGLSQGDASSSSAPKRTQHTLRPVTIKQLLKVSETHADGDFKLDGQDLSQVKLIAAVRNVNKQTTLTTYKLEDGTGTIDAKLFATEDADAESLAQIVDGVYVRVIGQLKSFRERNYFLNLFNYQSIQVVKDPNEITTHNLEVIHAHASSTRNKMHTGQQDVSMTPAAPYQASGFAGAAQTDDFISNKAVELLTECPDRKVGYHRHELFKRIGEIQGGQARFDRILNDMVEHGVIFTTKDEHHFASCY